MTEVEKPIEAEIGEQMNALARGIDMILNTDQPKGVRYGFFLGVFQFGDAGRFNYISNAKRADIVKLLEEMIVKYKGS